MSGRVIYILDALVGFPFSKMKNDRYISMKALVLRLSSRAYAAAGRIEKDYWAFL
jgi:hypothetical protein